VREDERVSDDVTGYPGAPPGWYADPAGGPGQRWWDGYAWTETTVLPEIPPPPPFAPPPRYQLPPPPSFVQPQAPPPPPHLGGAPGHWTPQPPNVADLVQREVALTPRARTVVVFFGLDILVGLVNLQLRRTQFRAVGHQMHLSFEASRNGRPVPAFTTQSTTDPLQVIFGLVTTVAFVILLIWQFRAASAARSLGYPAKHSPGWGVGCWFVPIVNFWMPYQAIRDCLPPNDPHRPLVLRWWLIALGAQLFLVAATLAALLSSPVALGISLVGAMFALGLTAIAPRVVVAISAAHQATLPPSRGV
jgi:Domain of unknown function (DUF4328)/Protein of unknown function (DUF2510)